VIDSCVLAEYFTRTQLAKAHHFARVRVNGDTGLSCGDEKHIVGCVEIVNDQLSRPVAPPGTASPNFFHGSWFEA